MIQHMGNKGIFIPDTGWYVAELVQEVSSSAEPECTVYVNLILVRATDPDQAFEKALAFGRREEVSEENDKGERTISAFHGLRSLTPVYEELGDGAEISYEEHKHVSKQEVGRFVTPRENLAVFREEEPVS